MESSRLGIDLGRGLATWLPCQGCGAICVYVQALTRTCGWGGQPLPDLRPPQVGITRFTWALPMRGAVKADPSWGPGSLSQASHSYTVTNPSSLSRLLRRRKVSDLLLRLPAVTTCTVVTCIDKAGPQRSALPKKSALRNTSHQGFKGTVSLRGGGHTILRSNIDTLPQQLKAPSKKKSV